MPCETATIPAPSDGEEQPGDGDGGTQPPTGDQGLLTARNLAIGVGALGLGAVALSQTDKNN